MVSCIFKVRSRVQKEEKYQKCRKIDLVKNIIREISIYFGKWLKQILCKTINLNTIDILTLNKI